MHIIGFFFDIVVLLNRLNQFSRFLQYPHMTFICYLMGIEDGYFTSRHDESFFFLQRTDTTKVDLKCKSIYMCVNRKSPVIVSFSFMHL